MQTKLFLSLAMAGTLVLTSCGKLGELSADNFTVTPSPLEAVSGKVPVTVNGRFPEKYMKKKAVVTVTPELRYADGVTTGTSATFQGEKVQGNDQEVSYKLGGNYTMKSQFAYKPEMQKSDLYLTFKAYLGKKEVKVPAVKVAEGVIATSDLLGRTAAAGNSAWASDAYQYAIEQTKQAQIKYLINQANIRTSELKSTSVQDFVKTLRDIKADQKGLMLENIEVSAYASPDGKLSFNEKLAEKRQNTSASYVSKQLKANQLDAEVDQKYTAEDWEGFKELVSASNIQDKEIILNVLGRFEDPEERERQIRNLSAGYKELADEILPELRRARLTIYYNIIGRTDDEIQEQYKADASKLSVEELLYAATLTEDADEVKDIYTTTTKVYPGDYRAYNNLASIAYGEGDLRAAKGYLDLASQKSGNATEVNANRAFIALAEGNYDEAQNCLAKAPVAANYNEILGNLQIAQGNYAQAAKSLSGVSTNSAALAHILNKDYTAAATALSQVAKPDGTTSYLKAIVAARTGQVDLVPGFLQEAFAKDPSLKSRAAKDLEFASLFDRTSFRNVVK